VVSKWCEAFAKTPATVQVSQGDIEEDAGQDAAEEHPADYLALLCSVSEVIIALSAG
jgi:hypothetical protein